MVVLLQIIFIKWLSEMWCKKPVWAHTLTEVGITEFCLAARAFIVNRNAVRLLLCLNNLIWTLCSGTCMPCSTLYDNCYSSAHLSFDSKYFVGWAYVLIWIYLKKKLLSLCLNNSVTEIFFTKLLCGVAIIFLSWVVCYRRVVKIFYFTLLLLVCFNRSKH